MTMIVKAYDIIFYDGSKQRRDVPAAERLVNMNPKQLENKLLDRLTPLYEENNPPCRIKFVFG